MRRIAPLLAFLPSLALAQPLEAIIPARVLSVIDGDTVEVDAFPWLKTTIRTRVRLEGIDTPEKKGECESERAKAKQATLALKRLIADKPVRITGIKPDKYGNRVVARLLVDEVDASAHLIGLGLARPYDGGKKSRWCE
jgi:endonuclease YncB( thermonuclease family)